MLDLTNWMMVFVRASAMMTLLPVFSAQNFPIVLRISLSAALAFLVSPVLAATSPAGLSLWSLIGMMAAEAGVGLVFGFLSRIVFFAIDFGASLIATEIGLNMPANFNPFNREQTQAPGTILYYLGMMLFLVLDMHHWVIAAFQRSYELVPIGGARMTEALFVFVTGKTAQVFVIALQMAAPLLAVSFLITLVFALLSRAVPQMNVFSESFGFRSLAGLGVFGITLNLMSQHISTHLRRIPEDIMRAAQMLGGAG